MTQSKTTTLADPKEHAERFARIRHAHQSETAEDYVELIADLIAANGEARVTDLSKRFGVSHATVNKIITRLKKEQLVISEPYRSIFLTEEGASMAKSSKERHIIVYNFLKALGISNKTAEIDAEGVEHHVSAETLEAFQTYIKQNS